MLSTIYIGMSGLNGSAQALRNTSNNVANLNTPGFKTSEVLFTDMFYSTSATGGSGTMQVGYGLNTAGTTLNFKQGELKQTGNPLDLAVDGQGLFTLRDDAGNLHYTRAGQFMFDSDGILVNRADGSKVMGIDANGVMGEISIQGRSAAEGKATATVTFTGNLSSTATTQTVTGVKVYDAAGGEHLLTVELTNNSATQPGAWTVKLLDGTTTVGTGEIQFDNGRPDPASAKLTFDYTAAGMAQTELVLDFSTDVTSFASGNLSTLAFKSQDGFGPGSLTGVSFDDAGALVMTYSNGQTEKGSALALGRFDSLEAVKSVGSNQFDATNALAWHMGGASSGGFGKVRSGMVELSNADLAREFSELIIVQRLGQASGQLISTANEMLQELFTMKSK